MAAGSLNGQDLDRKQHFNRQVQTQHVKQKSVRGKKSSPRNEASSAAIPARHSSRWRPAAHRKEIDRGEASSQAIDQEPQQVPSVQASAKNSGPMAAGTTRTARLLQAHATASMPFRRNPHTESRAAGAAHQKLSSPYTSCCHKIDEWLKQTASFGSQQSTRAPRRSSELSPNSTGFRWRNPATDAENQPTLLGRVASRVDSWPMLGGIERVPGTSVKRNKARRVGSWNPTAGT